MDKLDFLKKSLTNEIDDLKLITIDLDKTGLTICDILRNINKSYPINGRNRNNMIDGKLAVVVFCKSELLFPLYGIILVVGHDISIKNESSRYLLISVDECDIVNDKKLTEVNTNMMLYIAKCLRETGSKNYLEFSNRSLYFDYEQEIT